MTRLSGFLVLFLGLAALVTASWWLSADDALPPAGEQRPPYVLPVTLEHVRRGRIQPSLQLSGTVRSANWASLAFEVRGLLTDLEVDEADSVQARQIVARLEARDQELAVASAEADRLVAERQLKLLEAGQRAEVIGRLEAELAAAQADEDLALLEIDRLNNLIADDLVTRAETDRAQALHRAASAQRVAAEQRLAEARAGTRAEDLAIARARVAVADSACERARRELDKTVLAAPWSGSVIRRYVSVGDYVQAGQAIVDLADLAHLEIDVEVPAREGMRLGQRPPVTVRVDEDPDFVLETVLDARVAAADRVSRNFRGLIRLTADEHTAAVLQPGMFVRLQLQLQPLDDVLIVPSDAVRMTDDGPVLVAAERASAAPGSDAGSGSGAAGGPTLTARWIPVRLLGSDPSGTAVESLGEPLAAGDELVVTGVDLAYPGVALLPRQRDAEDTP